jgi:hypothetical protein
MVKKFIDKVKLILMYSELKYGYLITPKHNRRNFHRGTY